MSEEEFEKQTLNNLITDLKDIDKYTSFKNGAFIYDLGKYQGTLLVEHIEQLQQENKQLKNILTELEKWLCGEKIVVYNVDGKVGILRGDILYKIQELKEKYK